MWRKKFDNEDIYYGQLAILKRDLKHTFIVFLMMLKVCWEKFLQNEKFGRSLKEIAVAMFVLQVFGN